MSTHPSRYDADAAIILALENDREHPTTGSGWTYATDLTRRTALTPAQVDAALARLEAAGIVRSRWEDDADDPHPRSRMYRLTEATR